MADFSILSFWAVAFLTCIVGIFELLHELERWNEKRKVHKGVVALLYFGLLTGAILFLERCIRYYRTLRPDNSIGASPVLDILLMYPPELVVYLGYLITLFVIFALLFYAKITARECDMEKVVNNRSKQSKRQPNCFGQYDFRSEECHDCEYRNKCRGSRVLLEKS